MGSTSIVYKGKGIYEGMPKYERAELRTMRHEGKRIKKLIEWMTREGAVGQMQLVRRYQTPNADFEIKVKKVINDYIIEISGTGRMVEGLTIWEYAVDIYGDPEDLKDQGFYIIKPNYSLVRTSFSEDIWPQSWQNWDKVL